MGSKCVYMVLYDWVCIHNEMGRNMQSWKLWIGKCVREKKVFGLEVILRVIDVYCWMAEGGGVLCVCSVVQCVVWSY